MFGAERPVYATPTENIRAAQAVTDELDKYEGDERRHMTERLQQLLDAAAALHEAGCRAEEPAPSRPNDIAAPRLPDAVAAPRYGPAAFFDVFCSYMMFI